MDLRPGRKKEPEIWTLVPSSKSIDTCEMPCEWEHASTRCQVQWNCPIIGLNSMSDFDCCFHSETLNFHKKVQFPVLFGKEKYPEISDCHLVCRNQICPSVRGYCAQHDLNPVLKLCLQVLPWDIQNSLSIHLTGAQRPLYISLETGEPRHLLLRLCLFLCSHGFLPSIQPNPRVLKASYCKICRNSMVTRRTSNTLLNDYQIPV